MIDNIQQHLMPESGQRILCLSVTGEAELPFLSGNHVTHQAIDKTWPNETFDWVVAWQCTHTIPSTSTFLAEVKARLGENGRFLLQTFITPGTHLRGKKGRLINQAGDYINALLSFHDSCHRRTLSQGKWQRKLRDAGLVVAEEMVGERPFDFATWSQHQSLQNRVRLQVMIQQAPQKALEVLNPQFSGAKITFYLQQLTILAEL